MTSALKVLIIDLTLQNIFNIYYRFTSPL